MNIGKEASSYLFTYIHNGENKMTDLERFISENKPAGPGRYKQYETDILYLLASKRSAKDIKEFLDSKHIAPVSMATVYSYVRKLKENYDIDSIRVEDETN